MRFVDVPELLRRAADLVPGDARNEAGAGAQEVRDLLAHDEWDTALGVLENFEGIEWQTAEFWDLLAGAARQMWLDRDVAWCRWRASETRNGLVRAGLSLVPPGEGGRGLPVPGAGVLRPMWGIGQADEGLRVAVIWVEHAPEIAPGGHGTVRLLPLSPRDWRHLGPGDVITMHERRPVAGIATIIENRPPRP
jgi:hypothetical protein